MFCLVVLGNARTLIPLSVSCFTSALITLLWPSTLMALIIISLTLSLSFSDRQVPGRLSCGFRFSNACKTSTLIQLQLNAPNYFVGVLSDSSHCTYNSAQHRFLHFSQDFSLVPLPASQETIILFAIYLAQRIKPQSMNVYLAAARSLHISHGLSNPLQPGLRLKQTLRGIERKHFSAPK